MSKRRARQPFDTAKVRKITNDAEGRPKKIIGGGPPKKLTKGVKKQLAQLQRQNPAEYDRQRSLLP